jgi:predicted DNA binding CopG/RHH family protein
MKKAPHIKDYFDDEEKDLIEGIENTINKDDYMPVSNLTAERLKMFREAAKNASNERTTQITLRVPHTDLVRLKAQAMREGIPYQTWIKSILHKAVA